VTDPTSHPWMNDHRIGKTRLQPKDTRQHSPCPTCYLDATSLDVTAILEFRCPRGHTHTNTRGASIKHGVFLQRYTTHVEQNR
jgi:hypothetical protein